MRRVAIGAIMGAVVVGVLGCAERRFGAGPTLLGDFSGPVPEVVGQDVDEVLTKYGAPQSDQTFVMRGPLTELHVELWNDPANNNATLRELWYDEDGYTVVIWFRQDKDEWIAIDGAGWRTGGSSDPPWWFIPASSRSAPSSSPAVAAG